MRLIDADALREELDSVLNWDTNNEYNMYSDTMDAIDNAPTIEAEPVRHGRWIPLEGKYKILGFMECSICKSPLCREDARTAKFCPDCGAKMDGAP